VLRRGRLTSDRTGDSVHLAHFVYLVHLLLAGCGAVEAPAVVPPFRSEDSAPPYAETYGGDPAPTEPTEEEAALIARITDGRGDLGCIVDPRLVRAARKHAEALAGIDKSLGNAEMDHLRFTVLAEGGTDYLLSPFALRGSAGNERALADFIASQKEESTHCGIGIAKRGDRSATVFVGAKRVLELEPVEVASPVGAVLSVRGRALQRNAIVQAFLGLPDGSARKLGLRGNGEAFSVSVPLDRPGRYELEFQVDLGGGPETASLLPLFAGVGKDVRPTVAAQADDAQSEGGDPVSKIVALVNGARGRLGIPPLSRDPRLDAVALAHSRDMVALGYFGHRTPSGRMLADRLATAGLRPVKCGENVAKSRSAGRAHRNLMASPSHRLELLDPGFTHIGIGVASDGRDLVVTEVLVRW